MARNCKSSIVNWHCPFLCKALWAYLWPRYSTCQPHYCSTIKYIQVKNTFEQLEQRRPDPLEQSLNQRKSLTIMVCNLLWFILYLRANPKYKPPPRLYSEGLIIGGFFAFRIWEAYIWRGLFSGFYGISSIILISSFVQFHSFFTGRCTINQPPGNRRTV